MGTSLNVVSLMKFKSILTKSTLSHVHYICMGKLFFQNIAYETSMFIGHCNKT